LTFGFAKEMTRWAKISPELLNGYSDPSLLKEKILWALKDADGLDELAKAQNDFQQKNWNKRIVADRYLMMASGNFPKAWLYSPSSIQYFWGAGMSKEFLLQSLSGYITKFGPRMLFLGPNVTAFDNFLNELKESLPNQ
jgi:hypothetical protein